ncbi:MAG: UDP-N-acetylmuramoyl-tripeptide--D-alanyl-D-alanine ligase, partial [Bryobacteraceae bacterium]
AGWSVDTRTLQPGDLFFALREGHNYVRAAFERGAVAAVVEHRFEGPGNLIRVDDTLVALQDLATRARAQWGGQVVAITGSAGKTTTKDIVAHLLASELPVGKTIGNLNNHVGVPLSILRLPDDCRVAVLEMGMNHAGEIRELARIARPNIAVITNVGYAHIEFFNSIEDIALAKREIIDELEGGTAVLNADDPRVAGFPHRGPVVTYGLSEHAAIRAEDVELTSTGARFRCLGVDFESPLAGLHGVSNVLAGIAVAHVFGIETEKLREPVRALPLGNMRGQRIQHNGLTILNDCYNSNPEAARAMIDVLQSTAARRRVAVLGEMLELGQSAERLHREIGKYIAESGIEVLIGIRGAARHMVDEAIVAGLPGGAAYFFEDSASAGGFLREYLRDGDAILFKGSRGVRVERAMNRVLET